MQQAPVDPAGPGPEDEPPACHARRPRAAAAGHLERLLRRRDQCPQRRRAGLRQGLLFTYTLSLKLFYLVRLCCFLFYVFIVVVSGLRQELPLRQELARAAAEEALGIRAGEHRANLCRTERGNGASKEFIRFIIKNNTHTFGNPEATLCKIPFFVPPRAEPEGPRSPGAGRPPACNITNI